MARYFNIQITEVHSDGPFTVYYDSVDAGNIASIFPGDAPAENISRADLTSAEGITVYIPEDSISVILYNTDADIIAGCGESTVILSLATTPTPTPTPTSSPTVTPTPTTTPTPLPQNIGLSGTVLEIDVFGTSKVSIGGDFTKLNELSRERFVEAEDDGYEDTDFWDEISPGFRNNAVRAIAIDPTTGVKFVGGDFSIFKNFSITPDSLYKKGIVKLDSSGVIDESFNYRLSLTYPGNRTSSNPTTSVGRLVDLDVNDIQIDGTNVYIVAEATVNPFDKRYYVIKTDYSGNVDVDFLQNQGTGTKANEYSQTNNGILLTCAITSDGGILVGGNFSIFNQLDRSLLFKLTSEGILDSDFEVNKGYVYQPSKIVDDIAIQSDNSIIVVGNFTEWNNETVGQVVKLSSDGTYDTTFTDNVGDGNTGVGRLRKVDVLSDDSIITGGQTSNFGGINYTNDIVKLSSTGVWDADFITSFRSLGVAQPYGTVYAIKTDSLDNIYVGGNFNQIADSTNFVGNLEYRDRKGIVKLNSSGVETQSWYLNLIT
ncbi:MAG: delta-60 repeat domain-containing protein [Flavobacteriales bacterium]|nr:delta-60 repeat domain-containing protein [Flavobacteriales bacterium]